MWDNLQLLILHLKQSSSFIACYIYFSFLDSLILCLTHHMLLSNKHDEVKNDEEEKFFMPCDFCCYLFLSLATSGKNLAAVVSFFSSGSFQNRCEEIKIFPCSMCFFELLYPSKWENFFSSSLFPEWILHSLCTCLFKYWSSRDFISNVYRDLCDIKIMSFHAAWFMEELQFQYLLYKHSFSLFWVLILFLITRIYQKFMLQV